MSIVDDILYSPIDGKKNDKKYLVWHKFSSYLIRMNRITGVYLDKFLTIEEASNIQQIDPMSYEIRQMDDPDMIDYMNKPIFNVLERSDVDSALKKTQLTYDEAFEELDNITKIPGCRYGVGN